MGTIVVGNCVFYIGDLFAGLVLILTFCIGAKMLSNELEPTWKRIAVDKRKERQKRAHERLSY